MEAQGQNAAAASTQSCAKGFPVTRLTLSLTGRNAEQAGCYALAGPGT